MNSLFVEHLTVIDCAYLDAARGLVGESWIVDVELLGDLDSQSMVLDFGVTTASAKSCSGRSSAISSTAVPNARSQPCPCWKSPKRKSLITLNKI